MKPIHMINQYSESSPACGLLERIRIRNRSMKKRIDNQTKRQLAGQSIARLAIAVMLILGLLRPLQAELLDVEKDELVLGFIKLTDCAPLVIAKEKLFFEDEGLDVKLEAQANWKILLDRVISGELDGETIRVQLIRADKNSEINSSIEH